MRRRVFISSAVLCAIRALHAADSTAMEGFDVSPTLAPILAKHKIPGLAAVVLEGDTIIVRGAVGVRKAGSPELITLDDKFHLGSDTKAMTATLAAMLVEEGKLKWTTTLGELFGRAVKDMRPEWKDVTLRQVLAHRAGLPANPDNALKSQVVLGGKSLPEQRLAVVTDALSHPPESKSGTKYSYSNTGYILIGAAIEIVTGRAWEELLQERLFQPLGITSGGFGAPSASGGLDQPWGHTASGAPAAAKSDNPAFYGPAGTVHMTLRDWSRFVALHLRGDPSNPKAHAALLKPETFAALHTPAHGESYTSGWMVMTRPWARGRQRRDNGTTLAHSGSNTVWYCVAWLAPEIDFAVLVACNQGGDEAVKACDEAAAALIGQFSAARER